MRTRAASVACLFASAFAVTTAAGQPSTANPNGHATRVLPAQPLSVSLPLVTRNLVIAMNQLAWHGRVPMGFEGLADEPSETTSPAGELALGGGSIADALDKIVARQPAYSWSQENRVIHLRPKTMRLDGNSLLNQPIDAFELHDVTLSEALREVHFHLRPELRHRGVVGSGPGPRQLGLQRFSVAVSRVPLLELLDAIVVAHGAANWHVTYTNDLQWPYRIGFATFDGWSQTW